MTFVSPMRAEPGAVLPYACTSLEITESSQRPLRGSQRAANSDEDGGLSESLGAHSVEAVTSDLADGDSLAAIEKYIDARLHGPLDPEVLRRSYTIALAKNRNEKNWPSRTLRLVDILHMLSAHKVGPKDGPCFVQGATLDKTRRKQAMASMQLAGMDVDSGMDYDEVCERVRAFGKFAIVYSTHSHGKGETKVAQNKFANWCKKNKLELDFKSVPFLGQYLIEERHYEPNVVATITGVEMTQTSEGMMLVVSHAKMDKSRIIFPLAGDGFVFSKLAMPHVESMKLWGHKLRGLATLLKLPIDESCTDPSRLFYLPRHTDGAEFEIDIFPGDLLDIEAVQATETVMVAANDPFAQAAIAEGARMDEREEARELRFPKDFPELDLWTFNRERGLGFELADLFRDEASAFIHFETDDKVIVTCPFNEAHSNPGDNEDPACMVQNGSDADQGFKFLCRHESCQGRGKTEMLCEAINLGYFDGNLILDEKYCAIELSPDVAAKPQMIWPDDFVEQGKRIFHVSLDARKKSHFVEVCDAFAVVGQSYDENSGDWSLIIEFKDPRGIARRHRIPRGMIQADARGLRRDLAAAGLSIDASAEAQRRFDTLLSRLKPEKLILSVTQPGWHEKDGLVFVTPAGRGIDASGVRDDVDMAAERCMADTKTAGTIEDWMAAVGTASRLNKHWLVGVCTAFAGPLLSLLKRQSCGIAFTGASSLGKSTAQACAASVWGNPAPSKGLLHQMSTTPNALENLAARSNGTTLQLDELALMSSDAVGPMIFLLMGGTGKNRQRVDGGLRENKYWTTFALFSSERGLSDIIQEGQNQKAMLTGQAVRVADIDISNGVVAVDAAEVKAIQDGCRNNYGHAGPLFIRHLFESGLATAPPRISTRIREFVDVLCEHGDSPPVRRAAEIFGALRCGGEIAKEAGLLPADVDLEGAITWAWDSYREGAEAQALDPMERAISTLAENIRTKLDTEIVAFGERASYQGAKGYYDDDVIYVVATHLSKLSGSADKPLAIAKELDARGILIRGSGGRLKHDYGRKIGRVAHYQLRRSTLLGDVQTL